MMEIDLEQIKAAALAATPGPWKSEPCHAGAECWCEILTCDSCEEGVTSSGSMSKMDSRFSAAANPAVVLALIERLEHAEADVRRLDSGVIMTNDFDDFSGYHKCERRGLDLRAMIDEAMEAGRK